ncbi:MAG: hypothetical protein IJ151_05555 [Bacteroidales bacterium]|nr:hypothetical protein [Bacteroidales bacterium]
MMKADKPRTLNNLSKPEKFYLDNTNLMHAFTPSPHEGTLRETFFLNQVGQSHEVTYPAKGDFLVDGRWLFEVGGSWKTFDQIKDEPDSFLAIDDVEIGHGSNTPGKRSPEDLLPLLLRQLRHRREVRHHAGRSEVGSRCSR